MAYTFLDNSLNTIGVLTNKGGQTNDYWGDSITHEIATSQDVLTSVSLSVDKPSVNIDTSGNQKTWNHVIQGLSFNIDGIGRKVNENDYLIYQEGTNGKYYLMAITQVDESAVQSGFHYKTVQGLNAAAYDLSRKTLRAKSFAQIPDNTQEKGTAQNILRYIFKDINWDVRIIGSFGAIDYEITEGTTAQAVLLDIIGMFEAEVDAYVQLNNWGKGANVFNKNGSVKRIFDFSTSIGKYRGETVRYNKNMVSITKTGARDSMYTKLYVNGNGITIADVNHGADFIVDDVANKKYNKLGSVSTPVTYLEGIITNSAIESPTALLAWGKKQLKILNHPRYNYQISATNDDKVQLGDTVIIQDTHASDPIYLKSKVISKTVSLADPVNNSFIVGEFSPIVIGADNGLEDTNQIMQLVNQANQTAIDAQNKANENAQKIADTRTDLEKNIDERISEAKSYSDELTQKVAKEVNDELATVKSESDNLSAKTDQMIADANSYADTMYSNAVSFAKTEASKALSDANTALDEAKSDLTDGLNKEIADRGKAVSVANSQAQDYATQAKADAIAAANTADGQVRKDFKATTDALSSTISQNKEDADGKISTAQTTATQALNGLSTKVSQTDYDKKTGDLSTAVNTVTQTANETKDELASVSQTVDSQSAQINTISNTVDGTTQTISDIQTEQNKQSGSIATLQSRADGFDATVTKVNNLSVGGRNLLSYTNTNTHSSINPGNGIWSQRYVPFIRGYKYEFTYTNASTNWSVYQQNGLFKERLKPDTDYTLSFMANFTVDITPGLMFASGSAKNNLIDGNQYGQKVLANKDTKVVFNVHTLKEFPVDSDQVVYVNGFFGKVGTFQIWDLKLEEGTLATDWTPAPEDLSSETAKAQLTADNATLAINNYKTDADGRISQAQADIKVNANAITQKVSQSDYDKKTGDLSTKVNTAQSTANSAITTIGDYKTSNDKRVKEAESAISQNAKDITTRVSQTDYDKKTGELSGSIGTLQQRADGFDATVTKVDNLQVGGRNLLLDTSKVVTQQGADNFNGNFNAGGGVFTFSNKMNTGLFFNKDPKAIYTLSYDWSVEGDNPSGQFNPQLTNVPWGFGGVAVKPSETNKSGHSVTTFQTRPSWKDTTAWGIAFRQDHLVGKVTIANMKLEIGTVPTDWSPAPEDTDNKISTVSQRVDSISSIVSDPATGLTKRVQTAEGLLNQVRGTDIPALQKATFWQHYSSLNFNDYTKQGSFFFNTTSAKTNGPTSSTAWMYLIVEQGTADNSRIKQTAWYDGVNGIKITYVRTRNDSTWSPWYANDNDSVTTISQTNDSIKREITDRKTGDNNTLQSSKDFTTSSITNYDRGIQSQFTQTADAIMASVSTPNQLLNTEFNPDLEGWNLRADPGSNLPYRSYFQNNINATVVGFNTTSSSALTYASFRQTVQLPSTPGSGHAVSMSWYAYTGRTDNYNNLWIRFYDKTGAGVGSAVKIWADPSGKNPSGQNSWNVQNKWENITVPDTATSVMISFDAREGTSAYLGHPMLVFGSTIGDTYMPGSYSSMNTSTVLELFKDNWALGITDNIGEITSGIVGNSRSMLLISKHITIDGDTTFLGNNFMDGAVIKNASISSAKIDSLDVDKLTGNTAQFVSTKWDSQHSNVTINGDGFHITTNGVDTTLDNTGVHLNNNKNSTSSSYNFSNWYDSSGHTTSAFGLNLGVKNSGNGFLNFKGTSGASFMMYAGSNMNYGTNNNIEKGALNIFAKTVVNGALFFSPNDGDKSIQINGNNGSFNFRTGGSRVANGNYFWFNHNVSVAGTVSGASQLSKKNVKKDYDEDALSEISKTRLVEFEYKNNVGETHISPIIDDINPDKQFYIPETIVNPTREFVDLYSMISMSWKAIQQINEKMEKNNDIKE